MLRTSALLAATVLLLAPVANATWSLRGSFEPDHAPDVADLLMYADPDTNPNPAHMQAYFNVVLHPAYGPANPNVGATQTRIVTAGLQDPVAYLGVWKDCNDDGYIGIAESAAFSYRAELLLSNSICRPGSVYNDGTWVHEWRWIADGSIDRAHDHPIGLVNDTQVLIWGDLGLAGPSTGATGGCFINFPHGTFSSTGAMLDWADCFTGHAIAENVTALDPTGQLGFEDPNNPQCDRDSLLNQPTNLWSDAPECPRDGYVGLYQENSGSPAFTVWDCGDSGPTPAPRMNDPRGSYYDSLNATENQCEEDTGGDLYASLEEDVEQSEVQRSARWYFQWSHNSQHTLNRGSHCPNAVEAQPDPVPKCTPSLGSGTPALLGIHALHGGIAGLSGSYYSPISTTMYPPLADVRTDLTLDVDGPLHTTFYAFLGAQSAAAGVLTPGGQGSYGSEWCAGGQTGIVDGFDCDASHWHNPLYGAASMPTDARGRALSAMPGQIYQLRDIDCYDGSVASGIAPGIGLGLTVLDEEEGPC